MICPRHSRRHLFQSKKWDRIACNSLMCFIETRVHRNAVVSLFDRTENPIHHQGQTELHGGNRRERQTSNRTLMGVTLTEKVVNHPINLWGLSLYVSIEKRKGAKEQMILVSNFRFEDPLGVYRRRWEIETMFGCLKTRGFRMKDT